jgi:hypothetical protein
MKRNINQAIKRAYNITKQSTSRHDWEFRKNAEICSKELLDVIEKTKNNTKMTLTLEVMDLGRNYKRCKNISDKVKK